MINEIFHNLDQDKRDELVYAFNNSQTSIVLLKDGEFLGVNIIEDDNHVVIEQHGDWFYGKVIK